VISFPRLLYIGDVPVRATVHGELLLYRLLQRYPPEKLCMVESCAYASKPGQQLASVRYEVLAGELERRLEQRLMRTRFYKFFAATQTYTGPARARQVQKLLRGFSPEVVLTVSHSYTWITAARFAAKHRLPLHLICHDDWPRIANLPARTKAHLDRVFGDVYRQAVSRLCISPFMRAEYRKRYGVDGDVLLPSRAADCLTYEEPPQRLREQNKRLTVAFGGTINNPSDARALKSLADILHKMGGRLLLFGPLTADDARQHGLDRYNVELRGLVKSNDLIHHFRAKADVLFVPMSFDAANRPSAELSFPSKLADYTAAGLPLLIQGPDHCSAVRWALENPGVAEVVTDNHPDAQTAALERLRVPSYRMALAEAALRKGYEFFSYSAAERIFVANLTRTKRD
jgi:glycosyltransferase involved in cell wall biosynthesis